jgi:hypothetical protein
MEYIGWLFDRSAHPIQPTCSRVGDDDGPARVTGYAVCGCGCGSIEVAFTARKVFAARGQGRTVSGAKRVIVVLRVPSIAGRFVRRPGLSAGHRPKRQNRTPFFQLKHGGPGFGGF